AVVVALVAREAVLRSAGVAAGVARLAVGAQVSALERECGRVVVKACGLPATHLVAVLAGGREAVVVRVRCAVVVALVAREAILRRAGIAIRVAGLAVGTQVSALEREGSRVVVEARGRPSAGLVAILAGRREAVVRRVGRRVEVRFVTREAILRRAGVAVGVA
ncbi:MAG: hypothetical protein GY938_07440, partial [Ketobacter sp.]|nr:hypothetical protein [Ketobacter sp.]